MTDRPDDAVSVTVVRSGGVAGLRREWTCSAPAGDDSAESLARLVDDAPWATAQGEATHGPTRADGFVWTLSASTPEGEHRMTLPESALSEPWRRLVDRVRDHGGPPR